MPDSGPSLVTPLELDAAGVRAYVFGSIHYRGSSDEDLAIRIRRALVWYRELTMRARARGLLFVWVYDLGHLLIEGDRFSFRSLVDLSDWPEHERAARLEYENRFLNGFLRDPSTRQAIEFIKSDPRRDGLVARTLELLLAPLVSAGGHEAAPVVDPVLLRELAYTSRVDHPAEAAIYDALVGEGAMFEAMRSGLQRYFQQRKAGPALSAADLAEIDHWSAYKKSAQRLAGRRIAARAAEYPKIDPRGVAVAEEEESETELPDSGYYPQGGFSELANRGTLENLVPTELVYMGEDPFGTDPDPPIDLFALRFLESEALFFARDSGQLRRTRRTVHLAVCPEDGLRLQLRWHKDPLIVLIYGLCVRLSEDLAAVFPTDALRIEIHLLAGGGVAQERAEEDRELLRVLLRHEIARGAAEVYVHGRDLDLRALGERDRRVYGVAIQSGDRHPAGLPATPAPRASEGVREPRILVWQIGGGAPDPADLGRVHMPLEGSPEAALAQARGSLLAEIAGMHGQGHRRLRASPRRSGRQRLPRGLRAGQAEGEFVNTRDSSVLVWIPPGVYTLGTDQANPERNMLLPERKHQLRTGFYMAKSPVTWKQYRTFCRATGRPAPKPLFDVESSHPAHGVSLADAQAYCAWAKLRLPTEEEWECAARGTDGRPYPWGFDEPDGMGRRLTCGREPDGSDGTTTPVDAHPDGVSPSGCLDMSGNVWEWVVDPSASIEPTGLHWVRGGSWNTPPFDCRSFDRWRYRGRHPFVGFRVARSSS